MPAGPLAFVIGRLPNPSEGRSHLPAQPPNARRTSAISSHHVVSDLTRQFPGAELPTLFPRIGVGKLLGS